MASATVPVQEPQSAKAGPSSGALPFVAIMAAACVPLFAVHCMQLWERPHYQFFPIVLLGAIILFRSRLANAGPLTPGAQGMSWGLAGLGLLLLTGAELLYSPWLGAVATWFIVLAAIYAVGGGALVKSTFAVWLFLWLMIPLPLGFDQRLVQYLQKMTTSWSSAILDWFGIFHNLAGNTMVVNGKQLFVEEACAGVNSLFAVLTCALFYVLYMRISIIRSVLLITASIFWVLLANVGRICIIAYATNRDNTTKLGEGWQHEVLGYALFAGALFLIWSTDRLLLFLVSSRAAKAAVAPSPEPPPVTSRELLANLRGSWLCSWAVAGVALALLAVHLTFYLVPAITGLSLATNAKFDRLKESTLPEELYKMPRVKFKETHRDTGSALGEYSREWHYVGDLQTASFSIDYPFATWHELQECYTGTGWKIQEIGDREDKDKKDAPSFYRELRLSKAGLWSGYLFYGQCDQTGRVIKREKGILQTNLLRQDSVLGRGLKMVESSTSTEPAPVGALIQFQLFVTSQRPLSDVELEAARGHFASCWKNARAEMFPDAP